MSVNEHKSAAPQHITIGIITVSTTRSLNNDHSGLWIKAEAESQGHTVVVHRVVPDNEEAIKDEVVDAIRYASPQALLLTGGTGIAAKDVTIEAVRSLLQKELTAFGVLFAQLSFEEIGSAALMSRAAAGIIDHTAVFCMPGSLKACQLACKRVIFPELGHVSKHLQEQ